MRQNKLDMHKKVEEILKVFITTEIAPPLQIQKVKYHQQQKGYFVFHLVNKPRRCFSSFNVHVIKD